jgi:hypothetical protein
MKCHPDPTATMWNTTCNIEYLVIIKYDSILSRQSYDSVLDVNDIEKVNVASNINF